MKNTLKFLPLLSLAAALLTSPVCAQLSVPSDGSDGELNITSNTVIDLSQATTGTWSTPSSGNGIYDPVQWAVVFKYSSVNIASGATVSFANHYANPPVIWLVQSNVTINGTVSVNGNTGITWAPAQYLLTVPGPGGFRGGAYDPSIGNGDGLGPGGGVGRNASAGYQSSYGNAQILPLIGGSGEAWGYIWGPGSSGASGAGAILIVSASTVSVNGQITAYPSFDPDDYSNIGSSAGGGIRVVANQIIGNGTIDAAPQGRTRMEANTLSQQLNITPNAALFSPSTIPVIFPPAGSPTVSIVSIAGNSAPADPQANVISSPDVSLATNSASPVTVVLQTQNFPTTGTVTVRVVPVYGSSTSLTATYASGNSTLATWQLTSPIPLGYCVLQAHATTP